MGRPASVQASRAKGHIIARRWSAVVVADKSGPGSSASRNLRTGHCARATRRASRAESPGPARESPSTGDRSRNSSDMLHGRFERGGHCTPAHGPRHAAESTADMRRSVVRQQDHFALCGGRGGARYTLPLSLQERGRGREFSREGSGVSLTGLAQIRVRSGTPSLNRRAGVRACRRSGNAPAQTRARHRRRGRARHRRGPAPSTPRDGRSPPPRRCRRPGTR